MLNRQPTYVDTTTVQSADFTSWQMQSRHLNLNPPSTDNLQHFLHAVPLFVKLQPYCKRIEFGSFIATDYTMISTILLTGATGFIGFQILFEALKKSSHVRTAVRSAEKTISLLDHPYVQAGNTSNHLSLVEIKGFTTRSAFDEALVGVEYVIRAASPLPLLKPDHFTSIFTLILAATSNLLEPALEAFSIRRVVLTFSIAATISLDAQPTSFYVASTRVLPGHMFGRNRMAMTAELMLVSSNAVLLGLRSARMSLKPRVEHNDAFIIAEGRVLEAVANGTFTSGDQSTNSLDWNAQITQEISGVKFKDYETMVVDNISQHLSLLDSHGS